MVSLALALKFIFRKPNKLIEATMLALGILGTFIGVFIGLSEFDVSKIEESVPQLLEGLKTAFLTSITGMIIAIIFKIIPEKKTDESSDDIGESIVNQLRLLNEKLIDSEGHSITGNINILKEENSSNLKELNKLINGDGDSSMVSQIKMLRMESKDGFNSMKSSFEEFAKKVVADNTQSLIDALTDVMKDFNNKINEQFGENFKKFNEGIGTMLDWQKEYKIHVDEQTDKIGLLLKSFEQVMEVTVKVQEATSDISNNSSQIIESNKMLKDVLIDFSTEVNSFAELGERAKNSLPLIENNLERLTATSVDFVNNSIIKIESNYNSLEQTQRKLIDGYGRSIEDMVKSNGERVEKLDQELGEELNKSLKTLGDSLSTLSSRFTEDYAPLTDRLKEVVNISKGV